MIDVSDLIGIKYKPHGRDKEGFDCYGLVLEVEKRAGNSFPDFDYDDYTDEYILEKFHEVVSSGKVRKIDTIVEGAVVIFENFRGMKNHVGVYLEDGYFIHCDRHGVRQCRIDEWKDQLAGVYVWLK